MSICTVFVLQDELPESFQLVHEWNVDFSSVHRLIELNSCLQINEPKQYKAAAEFCKISGLLCSYGLYQVCYLRNTMYMHLYTLYKHEYFPFIKALSNINTCTLYLSILKQLL